MEKKSFNTTRKFSNSEYRFWANASQHGTYMGVTFQFKTPYPHHSKLFDRYCKGKRISIEKRLSGGSNIYVYQKDFHITFDFSYREKISHIKFTKSYKIDSITKQDFLDFKNLTSTFFAYLEKYGPAASSMTTEFKRQQYRGLVEIVEREFNPEERLVDEMAFLVRNKKDPKKVKMAINYIKKYAKMIKNKNDPGKTYDAETFLKKELGEDYWKKFT